ncbi:MAG: PQQ-binding-like beta-propeller repeat protein [Gemmatimonadetes bacterium]|nr:PQQ-binding-like beta-propeller repeat protein [Gemmatimonadota bacterium]
MKYRYYLSIAVVLCFSSAHADWPQWLGPNRTGISSETGLLTTWAKEGPRVVWEKELGEGFSGISVAEGRVYTMFSAGEDEFAVCLDEETGEEIWRFRTGAKYYERQGGNGPRSQPTVDGDRVFVLSAEGWLYALNAKDGKKLWLVDLYDGLGSRVPKFGFSTSPLVEGDLLLLEVGTRQGTFIALNKTNGAVKWASQNDIVSYSSPIAVDIAGIRQVVFISGEAAVGLSPTDGSLFWRFPWYTSYDLNVATPILVPPDRIFISSGYDHGAALLQISREGDGLSVKKVWESRGMKNHFGTSLLIGDYIYGFDNAILKCIEAETGKEQWKHRGYGKGTLIYADGQLIILSDKGKLALADASPTEFREKARAQVLSGKCWTPPTLANGKIFVRDMHRIVCMNVSGMQAKPVDTESE